MVKVWDVLQDGAQFIAEFPDLNVGSILSLSSNPDLPFTIAVGGDNNKAENFKIIDISKLKTGSYLLKWSSFVYTLIHNLMSREGKETLELNK